MAFVRRSGGSWVTPTTVRRRSGGAWVTPSTIKRRSGGAWVTVWTAYNPPVLNGPSTVTWSGPATRPIRQYTTGSGVSVSGGNAAQSVSWTRLSGDSSITCSNTGDLGATFSAYGALLPSNGSEATPATSTAVWRITYSDGTTQVSKDVTFTFSTY